MISTVHDLKKVYDVVQDHFNTKRSELEAALHETAKTMSKAITAPQVWDPWGDETSNCTQTLIDRCFSRACNQSVASGGLSNRSKKTHRRAPRTLACRRIFIRAYPEINSRQPRRSQGSLFDTSVQPSIHTLRHGATVVN